MRTDTVKGLGTGFQCTHGKGMAQGMKAGSALSGCCAQPKGVHELAEGFMDRVVA